MKLVRSVGVVGAGTMGLGIAQVCASAGIDVLLYDINTNQLDKAVQAIDNNLIEAVSRGRISDESRIATLSRIRKTHDLNFMVTDIVIEAAVERLDIKQTLLVQLEKVNEGKAILATNTSSISVSEIAARLRDPSSCIGLHFFNPADRMKLVEIISTKDTKAEYTQVISDFAKKIGKVAVYAKDSPGFIVNRVARHYYVESLKLIESHAAPVEAVDALMRASGFRMGPFELMDLIGIDTNLAVTTSVYEGFGKAHKFTPSRTQQQLVARGDLGRKTGKGFYEYNQQK